MARPQALLSRRTWRRLERNSVRDHEQYLLARLRHLAGHRQAVESVRGSPARRSVSLLMAGYRLVLGGVAPATARELILMAERGDLQLISCGRYGRFWWIAVGNDERQVTLASHVQLLDDGGRPERAPNPPATLRA
ncbi:MAG: hypothetical protein M0Z30_11105 [Actinomycetota bacterium]|nr:hypothetical protein [Actinomycetota bacterium]